MKMSLAEVAALRDKLHNLDFNNQEHRKRYDDEFLHFIVDAEKLEETAYDDRAPRGSTRRGKLTVGYGFNMDDKAARELWEGAFGGTIDFDEVYTNLRRLEKEEALILFNYVRDIKRKELRNLFGADWNKLKGNERMMLEDMYYNGPRRVRQCRADIKQYIATSDEKFLNAALEKVRIVGEDVPKAVRNGVRVRRNAQYTLGNSLECPWYRKPHQHPSPDSSDKREVTLGKTITPYKHGSENCYYSNQFYIWRTCSDSRVRSSHLANEGKVFSIHNPPSTGAPGEDYNCRCSADYTIPDYIALPGYRMFDGRLLEQNSFEHFIRFGNDGQGGGVFVIE